MSNESMFLGFIPDGFLGDEDDFKEVLAEEATKLAIEVYLRNRELEKREHREINSEKMNCFMASLIVLNRVAKRTNGEIKVIDEPPSGNIIAKLDEFLVTEPEMKLFRNVLLRGASINFEPLLDGRICVSVVVPGTYE